MNTHPDLAKEPERHFPLAGIAAIYVLAILGWLAVAVMTFRTAIPVDLR
jgi:hypothetical protein